MQISPEKASIEGRGSDSEGRVLGRIIATSSVILFACSSLRHALFQSGAFDLGIFDQAVYLIAQGEVPISSFLGFHILGDHAALVFYPLALLYKIYPDVHWLLGVQAIALSIGAMPTMMLARQAGLKMQQALAIAWAYLLYPLVFNLNLFDFHPEVIALPALLWAILAARENKIIWFCVAIVTVLACKAVLALTVVAMGFWLLIWDKRRLCGTIAICAGIAWFLIATQVIIPEFGSAADIERHLPRYGYLGNSFGEIIKNLFLQPKLVIGKIFSSATLEYLSLLFLPVICLLSPKHLTPMVGAIPTLVMNILSEAPAQRNLVHHYSAPILPFLLVAAISSLANGSRWLQSGRAIALYSLVAFLALAKFGYFGSKYLESIDTWQATRCAIAQVQTDGGVLTTHEIAPHLTHRKKIKFTDANSPPANLADFDYILLNLRHWGWKSNPEFAASLVNQIKNEHQFTLGYQRDDVYLFKNLTNNS